uniref:Uncharacterized protein n=1 Tax=Micrurus corallinus TaxID=54390 RepID=A0A2D4EPW7_MICCO
MGRFNQSLVVNGMKTESDEREKAYFLTYCDSELYELAEALVAEDLDNVSWDTLQQALKGHFDPSPSYMANRNDFCTQSQKGGESISHLVAVLRKLSKNCKT